MKNPFKTQAKADPTLVPGSKTPKKTVFVLQGRGYQPVGIQRLLPHLTLADIEAVLAEGEPK